jgi:hypothetical protein
METCCKSVLLSYTSQGKREFLCLAKIVQNKIVETLRSMAGLKCATLCGTTSNPQKIIGEIQTNSNCCRYSRDNVKSQ